MRPSKDKYYLDIAKAVAARGTCRLRNYGVVIVKDDHIISTGYTGSPRGTSNCIDMTQCSRLDPVQGTGYEWCRSVHAEMNAIIHASIEDLRGSTLYLVGVPKGENFSKEIEPCRLCKKMILNAGIQRIVVEGLTGTQREIDSKDWLPSF